MCMECRPYYTEMIHRLMINVFGSDYYCSCYHQLSHPLDDIPSFASFASFVFLLRQVDRYELTTFNCTSDRLFHDLPHTLLLTTSPPVTKLEGEDHLAKDWTTTSRVHNQVAYRVSCPLPSWGKEKQKKQTMNSVVVSSLACP